MFGSLFHHDSKQHIAISPSIVVFTVFFLVGLYFLWYIQGILTTLLLAFIIAVALAPVSQKLQRWLKLSEIVALAITYVLLIALIAAILGVLLPPLTKQMIGFINYLDIPGIDKYLKEFTFSLSEVSNLAGSVSGSVGTVLSVVSSTFSSIFAVFTTFVISFYMLIERKHLHKKISWITTQPAHLEKFRKCLDSIEEQLGGWVRAEITLMTTIGFLTYAGLLIFDIPYALPLAVMAGLLEILPNLGPTIAAVPAAIIAFIEHGWVMAVVVIVLYLLIQQVENNFLVPKVMSDRVHIDPLAVIIVILVGLELSGVMGALLSVPVYIILRTVYAFYLKDAIRLQH